MQIRDLTRANTKTRLEMVPTIRNNFAYLEQFLQLKHTDSEIRRLLTSQDMFGVCVYDNNNTFIGYLVGERMNLADGRVVAYISYLYVSALQRQSGIGSKLIGWMKKYAVGKLGVQFILLSTLRVNAQAIKFYRKHQFTEEKLLSTNDVIVMQFRI